MYNIIVPFIKFSYTDDSMKPTTSNKLDKTKSWDIHSVVFDFVKEK
jgi:hypothetical protein